MTVKGKVEKFTYNTWVFDWRKHLRERADADSDLARLGGLKSAAAASGSKTKLGDAPLACKSHIKEPRVVLVDSLLPGTSSARGDCVLISTKSGKFAFLSSLGEKGSDELVAELTRLLGLPRQRRR